MRELGLAIVGIAFAVVGCGDSGKVDGQAKLDGKIKLDVGPHLDVPKTTDGGRDKPRPNDRLATICDASVIGRPCTETGKECGATHQCLTTNAKGEGFCTCDCAVDDPSTPLVNEDSCPQLGSHLCATIELTGGIRKSYCLRTCDPKLGSNDCGAPLACDPRSGGWIGIFGKAVCAFSGCKVDGDCPVVTKTICSMAQKNCPSGQTCVTYSGADEGRFALSGACDTASGICTDHGHGKATAKIGDPCKDDTECAGNMRCSMEHDQAKYEKKAGDACNDRTECCSGGCTNTKCDPGYCLVLYRNGYCTIQGCQFATTLAKAACPSGSTCNLFFGVGGGVA